MNQSKQLKALAARLRLARADVLAIQSQLHLVIVDAHLHGMTYDEIAAATGLSYARARQIVGEVKARRKKELENATRQQSAVKQ